MAFLAGGRLERLQRAEDIPELAQDRLLELVERCAHELKHGQGFRAPVMFQIKPRPGPPVGAGGVVRT